MSWKLLIMVCILYGPSLFSQIDTTDQEETNEARAEQIVSPEDDPATDQIFAGAEKETKVVSIRSRVSAYLKEPAGYASGKYLGTPQKIYHRLKVRHSWFSGGILTEKDPGESRYADFATFHLAADEIGRIKKIIIGDFRLKSGMGLLLGTQYRVSKGAVVTAPVPKKTGVLEGYLSSSESGFFRGAAGEFRLGGAALTIFASLARVSATLDTSGNAAGLYQTGYFRSASEISKRSSLSEKVYGANLRFFNERRWEIGFTFMANYYSRKIADLEGGGGPGNGGNGCSVNYLMTISAVELFGEFATLNSGTALSSGVMISPVNSFSIVALYRNYPYSFKSPHGNPFGERGDDERGFYFGVEGRLSKLIKASFYADLARLNEPNPSLFPRNSTELFSQLGCRIGDKSVMTFFHRRKKNERYFDSINESGFMVSVSRPVTKDQFRINLDHELSRAVRLRGRYEYVSLKMGPPKKETGTLVMADVVYSVLPGSMINMRAIYFRTDSYDSGIYECERDLEGVLSLPCLQGSGIRWYMLVRRDITPAVRVSMKYSSHTRDDVKKIGTGPDQLPGNEDDRVAFQIEFDL